MKRSPKLSRWITAAFLAGMVLGPGLALGDGPKKLDGGAIQGEIVLAENGTSPFAIVTAGDAPAPVKFAAEELQKYVAAVTGARLPINADPGPAPAICVGQSNSLADDADRLKSDLRARGEDGGRAVEANEKAGLCLSHPEVARQVAANMTAWLDANPEVDAIDLWHNDSWTYCRCPKCSPKQPQEPDIRLAYTRTYIRFVNQVATLVAQKHPKVLINLLSYAHTTNAPPDAEPLGPNVLVGLCLFPRPSQRTMRPLETSPQKLDSSLRLQIPTWQKLAKHFYIYEYYTFSDKQRVWSMVSMMCDDMRYFRRLGVTGISSDQWGPGWYPLNMFAFGKLAWNPDLTPQEIVDDFCVRYYGRAAQAMAAYWNVLEKCLRESWNTDRPIDWRDQERAALIRQALSLAESKATADRIRSTAALHRLEPSAIAK